MRVGDVALTVDADRVEGGVVVPGADVDEPVAEHGFRHHGIAAVLHAPEFFAGLRVEGHHDIGARGNHLILAVDRDERRRAKRELASWGRVSRRLPLDLAAGFVQGHHDLFVGSVDAVDEFVRDDDWRAAVAVPRLVTERLIRPGLGSVLEVQAGRPHVSEVDVNFIAFHDRRRAGVAVLLVNVRCLGRVLLEVLHIPDEAAGLRVQALGAQRLAGLEQIVALGNGRGEVDLPGHDHGRRPPEARHRRSPDDVLVGRPFRRQVLALGMALTSRAAELIPIGGGKRECERERDGQREQEAMHWRTPAERWEASGGMMRW